MAEETSRYRQFGRVLAHASRSTLASKTSLAAICQGLPNASETSDVCLVQPIFQVGCNWRLTRVFSVAWDGRCRTTGTERNRIGFDLYRMGNSLLVRMDAPRYPLLSGPSNSHPNGLGRHVATGGECVDAGTSQHVGSTASMLGWTCQSSAAASFTVRPTFLQHGCCGPYLVCRRRRAQSGAALMAVVRKISGQLPLRAARPSSATRGAKCHGVGRCAAAPRPRTQ